MVETCTRTVHGLPLLRPDPDADERIIGALGRVAEYYGIDIYAFAFASSHYRLDPRRHLPDGSFAPSAIEEILSKAGGFNPEAEFPSRSYPRSWPFVGGKLAPPPPGPPSRPLVIEKIDGKQTIVWRGEIPSVHVPRRLDLDPQEDLTPNPTTNGSPKEVQPASRDPARDPP